MKMRGIAVDHATIQRWVFTFTPLIESQITNQKEKEQSRRQLAIG